MFKGDLGDLEMGSKMRGGCLRYVHTEESPAVRSHATAAGRAGGAGRPACHTPYHSGIKTARHLPQHGFPKAGSSGFGGNPDARAWRRHAAEGGLIAMGPWACVLRGGARQKELTIAIYIVTIFSEIGGYSLRESGSATSSRRRSVPHANRFWHLQCPASHTPRRSGTRGL